ncbi:MAG: hypothetical protein ACTSU5_06010 [Promethearchaeota archaeon]
MNSTMEFELDDKLAKIVGILLLGAGAGYSVFVAVGLGILSTNEGKVHALISGQCVQYNLIQNMGTLFGLFFIPAALLIVSGVLFFLQKEDTNLIVPIVLLGGSLGGTLAFQATWTSYLGNVNQYLYVGTNCTTFADFMNQPVVAPLATLPYIFVVIAGVVLGVSVLFLLVEKGVFDRDKAPKVKVKKEKVKKPKHIDLPVVPEAPKPEKPREEYRPDTSGKINVEIRGRVQHEEEKKVNCPHCGFPNNEGERICSMCGGILK